MLSILLYVIKRFRVLGFGCAAAGVTFDTTLPSKVLPYQHITLLATATDVSKAFGE